MFLGLLLFSIGGYAVTLAFIVVPFDKSAYTQAHGLPRSGIVTSAAKHEGKSDSTDIGVRLARSNAGHSTTTAHVPALAPVSPGATVQVLVDPQDPGYAELPQQQYIRKSTAQVAVIGGLVYLAVCASGTVYSAWAWRRQHLAQARHRAWARINAGDGS